MNGPNYLSLTQPHSSFNGGDGTTVNGEKIVEVNGNNENLLH